MKLNKWYEEREKFNGKFYSEKMYLTSIERFLELNHANNAEVTWDFEIDELFSFLFNNANQLHSFEDTIVIKYKETYIELFEIHGQGCFRNVNTPVEETLECVCFNDIVKYFETNEKPFKSYAMSVVSRALDTLEYAFNEDSINVDEKVIKFDDIKKYLLKNLK